MTNPTLIEQAITEHWGDRCPETEPGCPCCDAWAEYDALTASRAQSVTDAARKLIEHWDDKGGKEERGSYEGVEYWSPSARMIDTQFVVDLRAALEAAQLSARPVVKAAREKIANIAAEGIDLGSSPHVIADRILSALEGEGRE